MPPTETNEQTTIKGEDISPAKDGGIIKEIIK
ncbi:unnamed protein product, partial [Rotaria magnacalcarata]